MATQNSINNVQRPIITKFTSNGELMNWAVIRDQDNICDNVVVWDGVAQWSPPSGHWVKQLEEGSHAGIGWKWDADAQQWLDVRV